MNTKSRIIISLDGGSIAETLKLVLMLKDHVWGFKVNDLLVREGVRIISIISDFETRVMADPKLYDIPNTMENILVTLEQHGANIVTVHASSQFSSAGFYTDIIAGVTALTSFNQEMFNQTFSSQETIQDRVLTFAKQCQERNYGYLVCSPLEVKLVKQTQAFKGKIICPGSRPSWYGVKDDQQRVAPPRDAIKNGADLLVVGRPVLNATNPVEAVQRINEEIEGGLSDRKSLG